MNSEAIRKLLKNQPFEPFELCLSNGEVHRVVHPEFCIVTANRLVLVHPQTEEMSFVSLLHLNSIRILQTAH